MGRGKGFYSMVPAGKLKSLLKFGRDYSKPALSDVLEEARNSNKTKKSSKWIKFIPTPMGGMNKKR